MNEDNTESSFDKVKEGVKKVVGGSAEVVEGTAQGVKEAVEDTKEGVEEAAEDAKEGVEETGSDIKEGAEEAGEEIEEGAEEAGEEIEEGAEEVTDSETYDATKNENEVIENEEGGKDPMNPDDIAKHEPTAVKRDQNQETSGDPV